MLLDQVRDIDSHEMIPTHLMEANFGGIGAKVATMLESRGVDPSLDPNSPTDPEAQDVLPIDDERVWTVKGVRAPGAIDMNRRLAVLAQIDRGARALWISASNPPGGRSPASPEMDGDLLLPSR